MRSVVITGASSGIGKALSFEFCARGAMVVMAARSRDKLAQIESKLKAQQKFINYLIDEFEKDFGENTRTPKERGGE